MLYDDNGISIDGETRGWFTDDTAKRFEAYGWNVIRAVDGHDVAAVDAAIGKAKAVTDRPTLICCRTVIGKPAPHKAGTAEAHGAALGEKEVAATRVALGWTAPPFEIPEAIYAGWNARNRGARAEDAWAKRFAHYRKAHPQLAAELTRRLHGELPASWPETASAFVVAQATKGETVATRKASQQAIEAYAKALPEMLGGSADLTGSVFTNWSGSTTVTGDAAGNYLHFGVREFAMCAIANGVALHGGLIPYVGTFLTFSDYARNALRMAALMKLRAIFVFTHDSIGLGEDGPTHQSVEHTASLRLIPRMTLWRPCDTVETAVAWAAAIEHRDGPSCLVLHAPERAVPEARCRADRRHSAGRVRAGRLEWRGGEASGDHRDGVRSGARDGRARIARGGRHRGAGRVDALHERVRRAGRRVQGERAAARRAARRRRGRYDRRLAQIRGRDGRSAQRGGRPRHVRRIGAGGRAVQAFRLHRGERGRGGAARRRVSAAGPPPGANCAVTAIAVRRAAAGDAPAIARVRVESWRTTYRGMIPDAYLDGMQVEASTAMWDRVLTAGPNTTSVFVAEHRDEVVGFACGAMLKEPKHDLDAELAAVYLRREFQHAGLGRRLVAAVVAAQREHGATGLLTWVIAGNKAARAFYERLGGELLVEQPFQWDGMDLVEAGYGWRDLPTLATACAVVESSTQQD